MQSVAVESALVARIGYDPATRVLQATMRNGAIREVTDCNALEYAEFMAAESKGKHWLKVFRARAKAAEPSNAEEKQEVTVLPPGPLNTFHADDCCTRRLMDAVTVSLRPGVTSWECPKCGTEWNSRMVDTVRHWEPVVSVQLWPTR